MYVLDPGPHAHMFILSVASSTHPNNEGSLFTMKDIQRFCQLQELLSLNLVYIPCVSMATWVEERRRQQIHTIYILWHHVSNHSMCAWLLNYFHLGPIMSLTNTRPPIYGGFSKILFLNQVPGKGIYILIWKDASWNIELAKGECICVPVW